MVRIHKHINNVSTVKESLTNIHIMMNYYASESEFNDLEANENTTLIMI